MANNNIGGSILTCLAGLTDLRTVDFMNNMFAAPVEAQGAPDSTEEPQNNFAGFQGWDGGTETKSMEEENSSPWWGIRYVTFTVFSTE